MKKIIFLFSTILCLGLLSFVTEYDGVHQHGGYAQFAITHGHCNLPVAAEILSYNVAYEKKDYSDLKIDFKINSATLVANDDPESKLTAILLEEDAFGGKNNAAFQFQCVDNFILGKNWIQVRGKMTIKETTRPVRFRVTPVSNEEFVLVGVIDLDDYGVVYDNPEAEGSGMMYLNLLLRS